MANLCLKRVNKEIQLLEKNKLPFGIEIHPRKDNIFIWDVIVTGGKDTPHDNLKYKLQVAIPGDYPTRPPSVKFISNCYHPNVYRDGKICLDILQGQWSPIMRIVSTLISIQSLLDDPNPASPANREAAQLYNSNKELYKKTVISKYKF